MTRRIEKREAEVRALVFLQQLILKHPGLIDDSEVNGADLTGDMTYMSKPLFAYLTEFLNESD